MVKRVVQQINYTAQVLNPMSMDDGRPIIDDNDDDDDDQTVEDVLADSEVTTSGGGDLSWSQRAPLAAHCNFLHRHNGVITLVLLVLINLLNYIDRLSIAGVLDHVQVSLGIADDDDLGGLLQTAFIVSYMLFSPIFGYLGDRFVRKWIVVVGVASWGIFTFSSSFITTYWWFLVFRALVGIGEASYSTVASTIIADLFVGKRRTWALMVFYIAIPLGGALGYVFGGALDKACDNWRCALRVTPFVGLVCVILFGLVAHEPRRGQAEHSNRIGSNSALWTDVAVILKTKSFVLSTLGFTGVCFSTGALAWWMPKFLTNASHVIGQPLSVSKVSYIFGAITAAAGVIGVAIGSQSASLLRARFPTADALVCGIGVTASAPLLALGLILSGESLVGSFVLIFFVETLMFVNWALVVEIVLNVVVPTRRSTANAINIFSSHFFGDAASPYLIGLISHLRQSSYPNCFSNNNTNNTITSTVMPANISTTSTAFLVGPDDKPLVPSFSCEFSTLRDALYVTAAVAALGGILFLLTARFYTSDMNKMKAECHSSEIREEADNAQQPSSADSAGLDASMSSPVKA